MTVGGGYEVLWVGPIACRETESLKKNFEVAYNLMERLETKLIFFAFIFDDTFKELGICSALIHL